MPAPDTTVKIFHSNQALAPALSGQPGTLLNLLSACLVDGFGTQTVDSIVVSGGIATVTRGAGHTFDKNHVTKIAGATPAGLNGEKKVLSVVGNTYTFNAEGIADQTATGTITHSYAPLGWTKPHTGTNIAHFRAASGTQMYLRVDDSATGRVARGHGIEIASSITDYANLFPSSGQQNGGHYFARSNTIDSTARPWILVGDHRTFYLMVGYSETTSNFLYSNMGFGQAFGDLVSDRTGGDPYGCFSFGFITTISGGGTAGATREDFDVANSDATDLGGLFIARPYTNFQNSMYGYRSSPRLLSLPGAQRSGAGNQQYPNGSNGAVYASPVYFIETGTNTVRGQFPGIYFNPQASGKVAKHLDRVNNLTGGDFTGKDLVRVNSNTGFYMFDIAGPWR